MDWASETNSPSKGKPKLTKRGKILLGITGGTVVGMFALATPFVLPAVRKICLPYVPATTKQVNNVMAMLKGRSGKVIDLGSGDGRIVIEAAKRGFTSVGIELNPWLVWYSRIKAWREGVSSNTSFITKDLWKYDLSKYENIVIFGVDTMMDPLQNKLDKELGDNSKVIVCRFPFSQWTPEHEIDNGIDTVWLYCKQERTK